MFCPSEYDTRFCRYCKVPGEENGRKGDRYILLAKGLGNKGGTPLSSRSFLIYIRFVPL
jgi:hypothetical protein